MQYFVYQQINVKMCMSLLTLPTTIIVIKLHRNKKASLEIHWPNYYLKNQIKHYDYKCLHKINAFPKEINDFIRKDTLRTSI